MSSHEFGTPGNMAALNHMRATFINMLAGDVLWKRYYWAGGLSLREVGVRDKFSSRS